MAQIPNKKFDGNSPVQQHILGSPPRVGKVGRMGRSERRRPGQRRSSTKVRKRVSRKQDHSRGRWLAVLLVAIGGSLGAVLIWVGIANFRQAPADGQATNPTALVGATPPSEKETLTRVREMLAAEDATELAALIRPGENPAEVAFQALQAVLQGEPKPGEAVWLGSFDNLDTNPEAVLIPFDERFFRLVLLVPDEAGQWQIDLDSFLQTCKPDWQTLLESEAGLDATVRIRIARETYFNGPFSDDTQWRCYALASPPHPMVLYGYAKRGSPQDAALSAILAKPPPNDRMAATTGPRSARAMLTIRRPPGALRRQFEITSVLADDWVLQAVPLDQLLEQRAAGHGRISPAPTDSPRQDLKLQP